MLRTMMQDDAILQAEAKGASISGADEPFMRALYRVRKRYEGKAITTRDLLDAMAEELPPSLRFEGKKSLDWFLEGWVNGTALPKLELKGLKFAAGGSSVTVSGTIWQRDVPEDLVTSVPVYAALPGKQFALIGRVFADGAETSFQLSAPAGTRKIVLDPNGTVLTRPR
jgi:hypothetical protein